MTMELSYRAAIGSVMKATHNLVCSKRVQSLQAVNLPLVCHWFQKSVHCSDKSLFYLNVVV